MAASWVLATASSMALGVGTGNAMTCTNTLRHACMLSSPAPVLEPLCEGVNLSYLPPPLSKNHFGARKVRFHQGVVLGHGRFLAPVPSEKALSRVKRRSIPDPPSGWLAETSAFAPSVRCFLHMTKFQNSKNFCASRNGCGKTMLNPPFVYGPTKVRFHRGVVLGHGRFLDKGGGGMVIQKMM